VRCEAGRLKQHPRQHQYQILSSSFSLKLRFLLVINNTLEVVVVIIVVVVVLLVVARRLVR
jgi:hypothetical protein